MLVGHAFIQTCKVEGCLYSTHFIESDSPVTQQFPKALEISVHLLVISASHEVRGNSSSLIIPVRFAKAFLPQYIGHTTKKLT